MSLLQIVPVDETHIEGFHATLDVVAREKKYIALFKAPPLEVSRRFIQRNIEADVPQFVALDEGRVVGWCDIIHDNREAFAHCGVLGIGLLPGYRGQGNGKKLMIEALRKAKQKGIERVELSVYKSNKRARRFYERMGFHVEGIKQRAVKIDGQYDDMCIMALFLDDSEQG